MPAGGYQKPSAPAPVSGPGAMSKRTDGQAARYVSGLPYGDGQELMTTQQAAPMSGSAPGTGGGGVPLAQMSPDLFATTDYPEEPITAGANFGPGPGMGSMGNPMPDGPTRERLAGSLRIYLAMAESPYVSNEFRAFVNAVRSAVGG